MGDFMNAHNKRSFTPAAFKDKISMQEESANEMPEETSAPEDVDSFGAVPNDFEAEKPDFEDVPTSESESTHDTPKISTISTTEPFTRVAIEDNGRSVSGEWFPTMKLSEYIGDTLMILKYLQRLEQYHHVTMPIKACGIDPIIFRHVDYLQFDEAGEDAPKAFFTIVPDTPNKESVTDPAYELIEVDGDLYLSCVTQCVDNNYLNSIIAEATSQVKETGSYVFPMVGYRKLTIEDGANEACLLNTLRLNTYEMSILVAYMEQFSNMNVTYDIVNGKQCIRFSVHPV